MSGDTNLKRTASFVYVPVTNTLTELGLYITGAGTSTVASGQEYPPETHPELYDFSWRTGRVLPEFQFVFISQGTGELETKDAGNLRIEKGTMLLLFPDVWHRYRPDKAVGWTEYWISVNGYLMFEWLSRGLLSQDRPVVKLQFPENLIGQYEEVIEILTDQPRHQPSSVSAKALTIITAVIDSQEPTVRVARHSPRHEFSPTVNAAITEIWNHSHSDVSITTVAQKVGVPRRTLERKFAQEVGYSLNAELIRCRLERACRLLSETRMPIKSVAYASGFSNTAAMSRVFRRELDTCPSEFRQQSQKR